MNIQIENIFQLDELVEHAYFHKETHGDDFFTFLSKHYGELKSEHDKNHQDEEKDHKELPFQNSVFSFAFFEKMILHIHECVNPSLVLKERKSIFFYQNLIAGEFKTGVFQPPKQV